jgi:hypothetical protein
MDGKNLLMQPAAAAELDARPPRLDFRDFQRSIVLLSSFRSGSHMLKLSLGRLASLTTPAEPFNHGFSPEGGYTLKTYLAEGGPKPSLMTEGHAAVHHFLARFYRHMPERRGIILDIKYAQAYAFGVNAEMRLPVAVPVVLEELKKLNVPFIHLTRRDKVAQAISLMVAEDSGEYLVKAGDAIATSQLRLSPRDVLARAVQLRNASDNARIVMDALGVRYHAVTYEDLTSTDWRDHYRAIFRFIDQYADIPADYVAPTRPQVSSSRVSNMADIRAYVMDRAADLNG